MLTFTEGKIIRIEEENKKLEDTVKERTKELNEEKENYQKANNAEAAENSAKQIELVSQFLPKMMSKEEIKEVIMALEDKSIPFVMKHFKANYNGKCDMRLVQEVLKEI